jgi:CO/xanthine dehydrogenase Mo-binding subunit
MNAPFEGIGASVRRKEDLRFISGRGNYTDDINRPNQTYAVFRRSDRPHANIVSIDTSAAKTAPGVVAVYTAEDLAAIGGLPCGWQIHSKDGSPMAEPKHPVLAEGKVRHVGDPIAVVIAETKQQARDAAELIEIDLQDLPATATVQQACQEMHTHRIGAVMVTDAHGTLEGIFTGRDVVRLASTGFERKWKGKSELQSSPSLTDPERLPKAKDGPKVVVTAE